MAFSFTAAIFAQQDTALIKRLNELISATHAMDFGKILDYTYPKVFTIVPKAQLLEAIKSSLHTDGISLQFDSLKIDSLYPVFTLSGGRYAKIASSMKMRMKIKFPPEDSTAESKKEYTEVIEMTMESQFGAENVHTDGTGYISIRMEASMVAVKDEYAREWCFVTLKEKDPLVHRLFGKEMIDKLATYK